MKSFSYLMLAAIVAAWTGSVSANDTGAGAGSTGFIGQPAPPPLEVDINNCMNHEDGTIVCDYCYEDTFYEVSRCDVIVGGNPDQTYP